MWWALLTDKSAKLKKFLWPTPFRFCKDYFRVQLCKVTSSLTLTLFGKVICKQYLCEILEDSQIGWIRCDELSPYGLYTVSDNWWGTSDQGTGTPTGPSQEMVSLLTFWTSLNVDICNFQHIVDAMVIQIIHHYQSEKYNSIRSNKIHHVP